MTEMAEKKDREPQLKEIRVCDGYLQAQVIKGKLETAGIPVLLEYESLGLVIGLTTDGLGQVKVLVPADREDEALYLLEEPPVWQEDVDDWDENDSWLEEDDGSHDDMG